MYDFFPLIVGFIGSLHCLGMCGPMVLAYSLGMRNEAGGSTNALTCPWGAGILHHAAFNVGRIITYGCLGALSAALFDAAEVGMFFFNIRNGATLLGGALLVLLGLVLLKVLPLPSLLASLSTSSGSFLGRVTFSLFRTRTLGSKLALGLVCGFVPCCLSWAMIVTAATTRDPLTGFRTMVLFGMGTAPALLLAGISATFLSQKVRFLGERIAALSVIAMGVILILRGAGVLA